MLWVQNPGRDGIMLERMIECLEERLSFRRKRKEAELKELAVLLYQMALSYRKVRIAVSGMDNVSHEAIRQWYKRLAVEFDGLEQKKRRAIAIDETKIKIDNQWYYLWAAIDLDSKEILAIYLSRGRACIDTLIFLRKIVILDCIKVFGPFLRGQVTSDSVP